MTTPLDRIQARKDQAYRELALDLAQQVRDGDLTEMQANEWLIAKAEQWNGGDS